MGKTGELSELRGIKKSMCIFKCNENGPVSMIAPTN